MPFYKYFPALCLVMAACLPLRGTEPSPMPQDGAIPGWTISGVQKSYSPGKLFDYIDGGAEIFNEFGFRELIVQFFKKDAQEIAVELYRMDSSEAALGIYYLQGGQNKGRPQDDVHLAKSPYQWTLQKGPWFIQLNAPANARGIEADMAAFADDILSRIAPEPVQIFTILPDEKRIGGSEFLLRGPYGMQPIFTFGEGDILQLGGKTFAVGADYQMGPGKVCTKLIIPYPDEPTARAVFASLNGRLDSYLQILEITDQRIFFRDFQQKYGFIVLQANRLEISLHLVDRPN